ncbi:MAG: isochorismatase family protein [Acidobacteriota bacterium]|nr:isochorismatase family protein [Acidobacteriota bacterium]MDH3531170.1 isochorismatase family protein [Acidobacteriota bacterium]
MSRLLSAGTACLVIVDIQEAFRKSISGLDRVIVKTAAAARGFELLGCPIVITEQYPEGLGNTVPEIEGAVSDAFRFEKSAFSACGAAGFEDFLRERGITDVAVAGIEAHVCVNQTVHDLLEGGFGVHLLEDAVESRFAADKATAISKMTQTGAVPSTVEMALFELLADSKSGHFKEIQALIK